MVALLWQNGLVEAAIELELMWNQLLRGRDFSLLCAYPTGAFEHAELVDVRRVCELHTDLVPVGCSAPPTGTVLADGAVLAAGHACSRVYLPMPESVPAARHFVVDVLRSWGHGDLVPTQPSSSRSSPRTPCATPPHPSAPSSTGAAAACASASRTRPSHPWSAATPPSTT